MSFSEVPIGFGMALTRNEEAMNAFAMMTKDEKQAIWSKARSARSEQEMNQIIAGILNDSM